MLTLVTGIKMGAVTRKVEVHLYNSKDVAGQLGITNVAVVIAASKANVGVKDAGSMFFTSEDIEVLKARPGRGRPVGSVKVVAPVTPEVHVEPLNLDEGNEYYGEDNLIDFGTPEEEKAPEVKEEAAAN